MGGLEASIVNFFSPKDRIISFIYGEFGERWAELDRRFQTVVSQVKFPLGKAIDLPIVKKTLDKYQKIAGVLVILNETATGVLNPVSQIAKIVKNHKSQPLFLIDGISALGAVDLPMDKLGIDVLVTASQKAWMVPPGLDIIAVSSKA
jgi:aspartate aminotransferase-like enzyme